MKSKVTYKYSLPNLVSNTYTEFSTRLPSNISFLEEDGDYKMVVEMDNADDDLAHQFAQRECDRFFFLTKEEIEPQLELITQANGQRNPHFYITSPARLPKIEPNIKP